MQLPASREEPSVRYVAGSFTGGVFLSAVAGGIVFPTLPRLESLAGFSPALVGLILSMTGGVRLLSNAPVGSLLERVGTRRPLLVGFLLLSGAPFGYALGLAPGRVPVDSVTVFVCARAIAGVGSALVLVGGYTMITDLTTPDTRGQWLGYMLGGYGLGFPVGLLVGGGVADVYGVRATFLLAGSVSLAAIPIVFTLVPERAPAVERERGLRHVPALVWGDRRLAAIGTVNGLIHFLSRAFLTTAVVFAAQLGLEFGWVGTMGVTGSMLALITVTASGATLVAGRYSDSFDDRLSLALPSLCVMAVGFVTVAMVPTLRGIVTGGVIAAAGGGAVGPILKAYLGDISPPGDVAKLGGAYDVVGDLGGILAPVLALPAASSMGFEALYLGCAGLGVTAAILVAGTLFSAGQTPESIVSE